MTIQLGFKINLKRCVGCRGCELACKNEHGLTGSNRRTINVLKDQMDTPFAFLSMACNHCESPACIGVCPMRCFKKRRDGIVVHNPEQCIGCKSCMGACPFNAPKYNEFTGKIDKCNLCVERLDVGLKPACVSACISEAIEVVDIHEPLQGNEQKWLAMIPMAKFTNPSIKLIAPQQPACHFLK